MKKQLALVGMTACLLAVLVACGEKKNEPAQEGKVAEAMKSGSTRGSAPAAPEATAEPAAQPAEAPEATAEPAAQPAEATSAAAEPAAQPAEAPSAAAEPAALPAEAPSAPAEPAAQSAKVPEAAEKSASEASAQPAVKSAAAPAKAAEPEAKGTAASGPATEPAAQPPDSEVRTGAAEPAPAAEKPKPSAPKTISLEHYKGGKSAVTLSHSTHAKAFGCKSCHHEGNTACSECHGASDGDTPSLKNVFHKTCKDCHKKQVEQKADSPAPTKCDGCHK